MCSKLGLAKSGGKAKVLRRLRDHHEILEKQMSAEIAKKMFQENERVADVPRLPKLPSATQQALHNVTHHPFAAWCEACVLGRSRQSPHPKPDEAIEDARKIQKMEMDYAVTFTKHRHEMQAGEGEANQGGADDGDDAGQVADNKAAGEEENQLEEVDYRDQFGLTLVAAEDTTGWLLAIPVLEKGAGALKRVVEQLVRLSLQVAPGQPVLFQGNPEPAIRQIINACEACRSRLGLATEKRWVPRGSHQSNGQAEKAIQTIRTNGRTLRAFVESRVGAAIEGRRHFYPWIMRHAGFVYNRFAVNPKAPQASSCSMSFFSWANGSPRRRVWLGIHERNGAHIIGTSEGVFESRSIRRLPEEQQWSAEAILGMRGLPWSYLGKGKRKRPKGSASSR